MTFWIPLLSPLTTSDSSNSCDFPQNSVSLSGLTNDGAGAAPPYSNRIFRSPVSALAGIAVQTTNRAAADRIEFFNVNSPERIVVQR